MVFLINIGVVKIVGKSAHHSSESKELKNPILTCDVHLVKNNGEQNVR